MKKINQIILLWYLWISIFAYALYLLIGYKSDTWFLINVIFIIVGGSFVVKGILKRLKVDHHENNKEKS